MDSEETGLETNSRRRFQQRILAVDKSLCNNASYSRIFIGFCV